MYIKLTIDKTPQVFLINLRGFLFISYRNTDIKGLIGNKCL